MAVVNRVVCCEGGGARSVMGSGRWKRMGDGNMAWRLWCGRCGAVGEIVGEKTKWRIYNPLPPLPTADILSFSQSGGAVLTAIEPRGDRCKSSMWHGLSSRPDWGGKYKFGHRKRKANSTHSIFSCPARKKLKAGVQYTRCWRRRRPQAALAPP